MNTKYNVSKRFGLFSPNFKNANWLAEKLVIRGYVIPIKNLLLIASVFLFVLFSSVWLVISSSHKPADPNAAILKEVKALTTQIGKTMELPAGEQPTLATVTDQTKLGGQDFFAHAQNGDKLLVYSNARKAILYRPSSGKVIDVTNLISAQASSQTSPDASADPNQKKTGLE